jgi:hypothetical protein
VRFIGGGGAFFGRWHGWLAGWLMPTLPPGVAVYEADVYEPGVFE